MTKERMVALGRAAYPSWTNKDKAELWHEADTARSEEARLLEENRTQAETIKALADALDDTAPRKGPNLGPCWCTHVRDIPPREDLHGVVCIRFRAALRLAGVLP